MDKQMTQEEIRESGLLEAQKAFEEKFAEDIEAEADFAKALGDKKPEKLISEVDAMIAVYNEMIDSYCRTRFDVQIWAGIETLDPKRHEDKVKAEKGLIEKGITIRVIREQLLKKLASK